MKVPSEETPIIASRSYRTHGSQCWYGLSDVKKQKYWQNKRNAIVDGLGPPTAFVVYNPLRTSYMVSVNQHLC